MKIDINFTLDSVQEAQRLMERLSTFAASKESSKDGEPTSRLDLSIYAFNCLRRVGIDTIGKLRRATDSALLSIGIDSRIVSEARWALERFCNTELDNGGQAHG